MPSEFYDPGAQRADKVKALFSRIARRYDLMNDLQSFGLHRYWKRKLIKLISPKPGQLALDLCCGTGDLALAMGRHGAEVVGLDFTEQMLLVAQSRSKSTTWLRADALHLPFADNSFDLVTVGYGLRNLAELDAGLREIRRVLRPAGKFATLDFGKPDNALWRSAYFGYLRLFIPLLGLIVAGSSGAYSYILESLLHYPAQRGIEFKLVQLGFQNVRTLNLLGGIMSINYGEAP